MIMECQKIINLLDNTLNQLSKFRTKKWIILDYIILDLRPQC